MHVHKESVTADITQYKKTRIALLRESGLEVRLIAKMLGVSEATVREHIPPPPLVLAKVEDEYGEYTPIPFFPPDLPRLQLKPLAADQLAYVLDEQARILFPVAAA